MQFISGAIGIVLAGCALYGWGHWTRKFFGTNQGLWPATIALGLAWVIFLGGLLNLVHLAYPCALDLILLSGMILTAWSWREKKSLIQNPDKNHQAIFYLTLLVLLSLTVLTLIPARLYSPDDDLRKYFAHPARMIQTGRLQGCALNALGSETLGAQAFLQGFIISHLPYSYIGAMDGVFCFGLVLALVGSMALKRRDLRWTALGGMVLVILIHPQMINISSLYSTSALVTALIVLTAEGETNEKVLSLLAAGLIALKPTALIFLGFYWIAWAGTDIFSGAGRLKTFGTFFRQIFWTGIFTAPWLLLFTPDYLDGIFHPRSPASLKVPDISETINLFSPAEKYFGGSYLGYTVAALGLLILTFIGWKRARPLAASCLAGAAAYWFINVIGLSAVESAGALRYSIPTLIGVVPIAVALCPLIWPERLALRFVIAFTLILGILFFPAALKRFQSQWENHCQMTFVSNLDETNRSRMISEEKNALDSTETRTKRLQSMIPPGKKIIAWIDAPFRLDFRRNVIFDANESGVTADWAKTPAADYLFWQKNGANMQPRQFYLYQMRQYGRRMGLTMARTLDFCDWMDEQTSRGEIVAQEDGFVIVRLTATASPAPLLKN